jgi:arylsulfatase A-like enzyme
VTARAARPLPFLLGAAGAVLCAALLAGCAPADEGRAPGTAADAAPPAAHSTALPTAAPTVLLVTWDSVRADRVGAYGAQSGATPRLDALAAGGLVCESARAPAPITLVSHATLLTGTSPLRHGVHDNGGYRLAPENVLISEALAAAGWRTGAFVGAFVLDEQYGLGQGFEVYGTPAYRRLGLPLQSAERPATEVVDQALAWLDGVGADEPAFLWAHFYEPHFAYRPPEPYASAHADPYDGEIAACDAALGRLLDGLDARGRAGPRLVVVTSDHGEALGEHGEQTHGVFLYDATQRVPLVLHGAGVPAGRRAGPTALADVAPTVLQWVGLPRSALPHADGLSLLADAGPDAGRALALESWLPWHAHGWMPQRALVWRDHMFIAARRPELYSLRDDPDELTNLIDIRSDLAAECAARLAALEAQQAPIVPAETLELADDDVARLAALGYLVGETRSGLPQDAPDPRDRLPQLAARDRALLGLWRGRMRLGFQGLLAVPDGDLPSPERQAEGRRLVEEVAAELRALRPGAPGDPGLAELLGLAEVALGHWEAAASCFEEHLLHQPRSATSHFNLAVCHERSGRDELARAHMLQALRFEPRAIMATRWMAEQEARRGECGVAAWWYERLREAVGGTLDGELLPLDALRTDSLLRARAAGQPLLPPADLPR